MADMQIRIGDEHFTATWLDALAPRTCASVRSMLPLEASIIHARWSGEACWVPFGDRGFNLGYENATSYPRPGEVLFYPGGVSEAEILIAYGAVRFASKGGQLAGNPVLQILDGGDRLAALGREILWEGARRISFVRSHA